MNNSKLVLYLAALLLLTSIATAFTSSDFGYNDNFYTRYNNNYHGSYGQYGGPGNAYFRGEAFLSGRFSPGYTPRYGMFNTATQVQYSPGFTPRYGVLQAGMNGNVAFSPGYTSERYGLPLASNDGFQYSPGYFPRYGLMRIAAGGPEEYYPYTGYSPRSYYVG